MKTRYSFSLLVVFIISLTLAYTNCSGGMSGNGGASNVFVTGTTNVPTQSGANVMAVTLGGYGNEPYVSVTVCAPGSTTNCYTIDHLLLDSGSSGLRLFSNNLPPSFVTSFGSTTGECMTYLDGTIDWGPVVKADVVLGSERASSVPIQIIDPGLDSSAGTSPSFGDGGKTCYNNDLTYLQDNGFLSASGCSFSNSTDTNYNAGCPYFDTPSGTYNGIIGVNFLLQDCGAACATSAANEIYYSCSGSSCTGTTVAIANQVANPIGYLPAPDNNGITLVFPNTATDNNLAAYAILGIGTESNNTPSGVTVLNADPNESDSGYTMIQTEWQNQTIISFLDTGSNTYNFPYTNTTSVSSSLSNYPEMPVDYNTDAFIPSSQTQLSAVNVGFNGNQSTVNFGIANVEGDFSSYNVVNYIGLIDTSGAIDGEFDWGFPFFLGRTVYVGLEGASSNIGSGLYWAY